MRRLLLFLCLFMTMALCSCSSCCCHPVTQFSADMHISVKGEEYYCTSRFTQEINEITVLSRDFPSELTYREQGGKYFLTCLSLTKEFAEKPVFNNSFITAVISAVKSIDADSCGETIYGTSENGDYTVTTDPKTGFITQLKIDNISLTADFSSQTML